MKIQCADRPGPRQLDAPKVGIAEDGGEGLPRLAELRRKRARHRWIVRGFVFFVKGREDMRRCPPSGKRIVGLGPAT